MPPEIRFVMFHEAEKHSFYSIIYDGYEVGTLGIRDIPEYNNTLNFGRNVEFGVEKTSRIINAIFCRFGAINFKIGSN
jgi:hypothetical protein